MKSFTSENSIDSRLIHKVDKVTYRASADHFSSDDRCFNWAWQQARLSDKHSKGKYSQQNKDPKLKQKKIKGLTWSKQYACPKGRFTCHLPTVTWV